jgi:hypothetical protein
MEHKSLIDEITEYCDRMGISPSTLCVRVLGNSRFMHRLSRKVEKLDQDTEKLRAYMALHPEIAATASEPPSDEAAA